MPTTTSVDDCCSLPLLLGFQQKTNCYTADVTVAVAVVQQLIVVVIIVINLNPTLPYPTNSIKA